MSIIQDYHCIIALASNNNADPKQQILGLVYNLVPQTIASQVHSMIATVDTPDEQLNKQHHLLIAHQLAPSSFDAAFMAAQQLIEEQHQQIVEQRQQILQQHLLLEAKMLNFFAFLQQQHKNRSQHISSPPPKPIPPFDAIYLCTKIY